MSTREDNNKDRLEIQLEAAREVVGYARAYRALGEMAAPELDWALTNWDEVLLAEYSLGDEDSAAPVPPMNERNPE